MSEVTKTENSAPHPPDHANRTLKEHLIAHLRARPGKHDPETQRIAKEFHSTQAVDLEKNLIKNHIEDHVRSRAGEGFHRTRRKKNTPPEGRRKKGGAGLNFDNFTCMAVLQSTFVFVVLINERGVWIREQRLEIRGSETLTSPAAV